MSSLVSVIVPIYNGQRYIKNCVNSLSHQSYTNIEIIFVNDGSTDGSEQLIKSSMNELKEYGISSQYLYQENRGAAAAVNSALKVINGKYLMLFDVDDILMPDAIKLKAEFLDNHPDYGMVRNNGYYNKAEKINDNSYLFVRSNREKNETNIFEAILLGKTNNWSSSFMVSVEKLFLHLKNREIYISRYGQNMQIMLPVAYYYKSGFIDKPLMRYVSYGESVSRVDDKMKQLDLIKGFENNRLGIIQLMDISETEKDKWNEYVRVFYIHIYLKFAFQIDDFGMMKKMFCMLEKKKDVRKQDKMLMFYMRHRRIKKVILFIKRFYGLFDASMQHIQGFLFRYKKDMVTFEFR